MPNKAPKRLPTKDLKVLFPDDLPVVYSNYANFTVAPFDVTIDFGIRHDGPPQGPTAKINTRLIMSPQHAKVFIEKLSTLLATYEKEIGEIPTEKPKK